MLGSAWHVGWCLNPESPGFRRGFFVERGGELSCGSRADIPADTSACPVAHLTVGNPLGCRPDGEVAQQDGFGERTGAVEGMSRSRACSVLEKNAAAIIVRGVAGEL